MLILVIATPASHAEPNYFPIQWSADLTTAWFEWTTNTYFYSDIKPSVLGNANQKKSAEITCDFKKRFTELVAVAQLYEIKLPRTSLQPKDSMLISALKRGALNATELENARTRLDSILKRMESSVYRVRDNYLSDNRRKYGIGQQPEDPQFVYMHPENEDLKHNTIIKFGHGLTQRQKHDSLLFMQLEYEKVWRERNIDQYTGKPKPVLEPVNCYLDRDGGWRVGP